MSSSQAAKKPIIKISEHVYSSMYFDRCYRINDYLATHHVLTHWIVYEKAVWERKIDMDWFTILSLRKQNLGVYHR